MDRTKVMKLAERSGGLFRLAVLLQKRVHELVNGAPKLVKTDEDDPINIAMLEVEAEAIELVDLSEAELAALQAQTAMASEEAEILEALRSRVGESMSSASSAPSMSSLVGDDDGGDEVIEDVDEED
jgi:DNA-directed RNA polymerase subunit K/omega